MAGFRKSNSPKQQATINYGKAMRAIGGCGGFVVWAYANGYGNVAQVLARTLAGIRQEKLKEYEKILGHKLGVKPDGTD
jgi:hypothetical protein